MFLNLKTEPTVEPLTTAEAKTHLRVSTSDEDNLISDIISAARRRWEDETGRALLDQEWELLLDDFPGDSGTIRIPKPPLRSIESVKYIDTDGTTVTLGVGKYRVSEGGDWPARVTPAHEETWPTTRRVTDAVTVTFKAGYGTAASEVRNDDKLSIRQMVAHYWLNREEVGAGCEPAVTPKLTQRLLNMRRVVEFM